MSSRLALYQSRFDLNRWVSTAVLAVALALSVSVTETASAEAFSAEVVKDKVDIRAGAGRTFYVVGQLSRGDTVQVREVIYGWYRIEPPKTVYSFIRKANVNATGDGSVGVVNADGTRITAGSTEGPGGSYRRQLDLSKGERVRILGEDGDFYRIIPPKNAFVYVPPDSIRRVVKKPVEVKPDTSAGKTADTGAKPPVKPDTAAKTGGDAKAGGDGKTADAGKPKTNPTAVAEVNNPGKVDVKTDIKPDIGKTDVPVADATGAGVKPQTPKDMTPKTGDTAAATDDKAGVDIVADKGAATADAVKTGDDKPAIAVAKEEPLPAIIQKTTAAVQDAELQFRAMYKKPLDEQDWTSITLTYQALTVDTSLPDLDKRIVALRMAQIKRNEALTEALTSLKQAKPTLPEVKPAKPIEATVSYDAVGLLLASRVYDGTQLPRLYRLSNPSTQETIAYVEPNAVTEEIRVLGRIVGIVGKTHVHPRYNIRIIQVQRIEPLNADSLESREDAAKEAAKPATSKDKAQADASR